MPHFPPPPQLPPKAGLFRRTPPAVFPAVLGLLGLGLAWQRAVAVFGFPAAPVDLYQGMVTLLFLFCLAAYGVKVASRPGVVAEDMSNLPGRTGLAALAIALMALAATLVPVAPTAAMFCLGLGVAGLLAIALSVVPALIKGTDTSGPLTPAAHLVFVGFIVAPLAAVPLEIPVPFILAVIWYCIPAAALVMVLTMGPLLRADGAPPLRPLHAIHLAPPSFVATGALLTGQQGLAVVALGWSFLIFALLALRARWISEGGFSGFWSAFTFPLAAFAGALMQVGNAMGWSVVASAGAVVLVAATLAIPVIAVRILKLWATGMLAAKTNSASA